MLKGMLLGLYSLQGSRLPSSCIDDLSIMSAFLAFLFPYRFCAMPHAKTALKPSLSCEKYTHEG